MTTAAKFLKLLLLVVSGWLQPQQALLVEDLKTENCIEVNGKS